MAQPPLPRPRSPGFHPLEDFQNAPRIPRPNLAETLIPVAGPWWQAAGDLQDGHYWSAAANFGAGALELLPVGEAVEGLNAAAKIDAKLLGKVRSADNIARAMKDAGIVRQTDQVHHIVPLKGAPRFKPNWKNHPAILKGLDKAPHMRLHHRWKGAPKFGPAEQLWHGTNRWMKTTTAGLLGYVTDNAANIAQENNASTDKSNIR